MSALIDPDDSPVERCLAMCSEVQYELKKDVFSFDSHDRDDDSPYSTTVSLRHFEEIPICRWACDYILQVGLVMRGAVIESTIIGGPAYASLLLGPGDVILKVDDKPATKENVSQLLIGSDKPGSKVNLTVAKDGEKVHMLQKRCVRYAAVNIFLYAGLHRGALDQDGILSPQRETKTIRPLRHPEGERASINAASAAS